MTMATAANFASKIKGFLKRAMDSFIARLRELVAKRNVQNNVLVSNQLAIAQIAAKTAARYEATRQVRRIQNIAIIAFGNTGRSNPGTGFDSISIMIRRTSGLIFYSGTFHFGIPNFVELRRQAINDIVEIYGDTLQSSLFSSIGNLVARAAITAYVSNQLAIFRRNVIIRQL